MDRFITRANIDHYLSLLNASNLTLQNRRTITNLLIAEEDKLGHDLEQLEFAEARTARSRERISYFKKLRDNFVEGSPDRTRLDGMLANYEITYDIMQQSCLRLRQMVNSRCV